MAVIPMQKIKLLVHRSDADTALDVMQRFSALELKEIETTQHQTIVFRYANILPRLEHAIVFLAPYGKKKGLWKTLREGSKTELSETDINRILNDTDALESIVSDSEVLQVGFAEKNEAIRVLEEQRTFLLEWKHLPFPLSKLTTETTVTKLVRIRQTTKAFATLAQHLETLLLEASIPHMVTPVDECHATVTLAKKVNHSQFVALMESIGAEIVTPLALIETPDVELVAVEEQLAKLHGEVGLLHDQTEHMAKLHLSSMQVSAEVLGWARERHTALQHAAATERVLVFTGWLNADKRTAIEAAFQEQKLAATMADIQPEEDEQPPVDIKNPDWIQPFEAVTRLYGMPGYKDLDPTVFLAGFFLIFFGLSLTDVGYGLVLALASGFLLLFAKLEKGARSMATLMFYLGSSTVVIGALFGGYLGVSMDMLPEPLRNIQLFDPIGDPIPVFYLALALGVVQVMVGLMVKIYSDVKNGKWLEGVLDQGPWLLMFSVGILFVLTKVEYISFLTGEQIKHLALFGALLIVLAAGRHPVPIVQKIVAAFGGLYAGVSYFSDILSYSRLLALGLATSALAFAVNLIAGMLSDIPYVGFILAAIILIIGHGFTLAINTLGAFVHSARLQFVEFFGKFITGSGKEFSPLIRKKRFATIKDD